MVGLRSSCSPLLLSFCLDVWLIGKGWKQQITLRWGYKWSSLSKKAEHSPGGSVFCCQSYQSFLEIREGWQLIKPLQTAPKGLYSLSCFWASVPKAQIHFLQPLMLLRASLKPCNMVGAPYCLFCDWTCCHCHITSNQLLWHLEFWHDVTNRVLPGSLWWHEFGKDPVCLWNYGENCKR